MEVTIDGPSAWVVVVGGFLMQFLIIGYLKSTGILMREFQAYFRCSNTLVLLVTSITLSLINILSPACSLLSRRVPLRWMVTTSALLICLSMCLLFAWFSLPLWVACLGLCIGACLSACYSSVICKVNECFERRRDLANGICFAGSSTGAVVMPLLFTYLTDRYSVAGCCLLLGGYFLHLLIVGLLMPTGVRATVDAPRPHLASEAALSVGSQQLSSSRLGELAGCPPQQQQLQPQRKRKGTVMGHLTTLSTGQRWLTLIYILATMLSNLGFTSQYIIFPMFLAEFSVPNTTTAVLVAVNGCLSDRFRWRKPSILIFGMTSQGVVCVLVASCSGLLTVSDHRRLVLFAAYAVLGGAGGGVYMSIVTSVLVSFVGIANLSFIHSIVCSSWTLAVFPGQTLLGHLKDQTGTFKYSFAVAGLLMMCASIVMLLERLVKRDNEEQPMKSNQTEAMHQQCEEQGDPVITDMLMKKNDLQAEHT